jgi:hypothetical protein
VVKELDLKLHVKRHPADTHDAWSPYLDSAGVTMIDDQRLMELVPVTGTVLGTFSTLQLPLAALAHIALITLEIHPQTGPFPSKPFVDAGVAAAASNFSQLRALLRDRDGLRASQTPHKPAFIKQFMHRFDGQSGARLRDTIVANDQEQHENSADSL